MTYEEKYVYLMLCGLEHSKCLIDPWFWTPTQSKFVKGETYWKHPNHNYAMPLEKRWLTLDEAVEIMRNCSK